MLGAALGRASARRSGTSGWGRLPSARGTCSASAGRCPPGGDWRGGLSRSLGGRLHVALDDPAAGAGPLHAAQVDAQVGGQPAGQRARRGPWPPAPLARRPAGAGAARAPAAGRGGGAAAAWAAGGAACRSGGAAGAGPGRLPAAGPPRRPPPWRAAPPFFFSASASAAEMSSPALPMMAMGGAHRHGGAVGDQQLEQHALVERLEVHGGLVGLDLGHEFTGGDLVPLLLLPLAQDALLHRVGELRHFQELSHFGDSLSRVDPAGRPAAGVRPRPERRAGRAPSYSRYRTFLTSLAAFSGLGRIEASTCRW